MLRSTARSLPMLALLLALPCSLAAQDTARVAGERWTERTNPRRCLEPIAASDTTRLRWELVHLQPLDSAAAIAFALRAIGHRESDPPARVIAYYRAPNGILISFDFADAAARARGEVLDGTETVYVYDGRCVTILGW